MKHIYILTTFLLLLSTSLVSAQTFTIGDLEYTVLTGTDVEVGKGASCPTGVLSIPTTVIDPTSSIQYTVTVISDLAFVSCSITEVTMPNTINSIGANAFVTCTALTKVIISNSVTSIGSNAFRGCSVLNELVIGNSVATIVDFAFQDCIALTEVTIPNSVTTLGSRVFRDCTALNQVVIGDSVPIINDRSFEGCTSLTEVVIPNSVTSLGSRVFRNCTALTQVIIPNSVASIGGSAFRDCTSLTEVTVNWQTPLVVTTDVFLNLTLGNITLNVPSGTVALYEAEAVWQDFNPIQETPTLSATEFELNKRLKLYPNPSKDFIQVSGLEKTEKYSIYNVIGVEVAKGTIVNNNSIAIQHLTNGMYFLKFDNANSIKFIKE